MKLSPNEPTVTEKWPIEVPTHQYSSVPTVYKVYFGKKYFIWKGKSLLQSCQYLAESIERYMRMNKNNDTDYLYHVCNHIKRTRCIKATVEVIANDYIRVLNGAESINGYAMLVEEQKQLDKAKREPEMCLNNNEEAYVPAWISAAHKEKFEKFLFDRKKKAK